MRNLLTCSILIGLGLALVACQSVQDITDALEGRSTEGEGPGLGPAKGPPLTMPPEYTLRPPLAGAGASDNRAAAQVARSRTFSLPSSGTAATSASGVQPASQGPTAGERAFVKRLQGTTGPVEPSVRTTIGNETQALGEKDEKFVDKLLTWKDAPPPKGAASQSGQTVVEKPANDSPQVVIQRKRGILDSLF
ncbi:MAG: DUF3035 domain-containing protein [Alphaproteobacteria bacterium]